MEEGEGETEGSREEEGKKKMEIKSKSKLLKQINASLELTNFKSAYHPTT